MNNRDTRDTRYTGEPITITAQAAALPDHKGYGTLVSLRQAMSLDPDFAPDVATAVNQLTSLDLDTLRGQALPILTGWALASPLGDGDRDPSTVPVLLNPRADIHVLVMDGAFGRDEVINFAYRTTATELDQNGDPVVHSDSIHVLGCVP